MSVNILKKFSYALGYERGVEIFPKQQKLQPADQGNFVNLPYHNGNTRVLINHEGETGIYSPSIFLGLLHHDPVSKVLTCSKTESAKAL